MTTLESTDLARAREYFDETRKLLAEATGGLTDAQWQFTPGADRWSIALILEHMVIVQDRVLGPVWEQLIQAPAPPPDRDPGQIDAIVFEKIPDRSLLKVKAPEMIEPKGLSGPAENLERLSRNYERLLALVESTPGLRDHVMEAAPLRIVTNGAFTTMDAYQWAVTVAAHDRRHLGQMAEVKAEPGYPG